MQKTARIISEVSSGYTSSSNTHKQRGATWNLWKGIFTYSFNGRHKKEGLPSRLTEGKISEDANLYTAYDHSLSSLLKSKGYVQLPFLCVCLNISLIILIQFVMIHFISTEARVLSGRVENEKGNNNGQCWHRHHRTKDRKKESQVFFKSSQSAELECFAGWPHWRHILVSSHFARIHIQRQQKQKNSKRDFIRWPIASQAYTGINVCTSRRWWRWWWRLSGINCVTPKVQWLQAMGYA